MPILLRLLAALIPLLITPGLLFHYDIFPKIVLLALATAAALALPLGHADYFGWWLAIAFFCSASLVRVEIGLWRLPHTTCADRARRPRPSARVLLLSCRSSFTCPRSRVGRRTPPAARVLFFGAIPFAWPRSGGKRIGLSSISRLALSASPPAAQDAPQIPVIRYR